MSATSVFQRAYRSAIALNNSGVALTERQCYWQALETMKDAMTMFRLSFRIGTNSNNALELDNPGDIWNSFEDHSQLEHIQRCTHNASLRLANPQRYHSGPYGTGTYFCVRTFATSDYDKPSSAFVQQGSEEARSAIQCGDAVTHPIRCDDIENECCDDDDCTCLETKAAIILHNLALVHWCLSKVTGTPIHSSVAQELLVKSHKIMERLTMRSCDGLFDLGFRLTILSITVVHSLLLVLREPSQSCMSRSEISELREHLNTLQDAVRGTWWDEGLFVAAAAA